MRKKFKSEDSIERQKILEKFEAVCAMFALDLIGVKVFGYSDETAEAVASGEKLLKESGTIYESFADMMSPEDAKRYLDFLENGSREGLTSAELADALLVSQKVEYEDVWDLRNAGDVLESGSNTTRRQAFREAKEAAGIPKSAEYKTHKFVFDGTSENRIVYEFDVCGEKKYIIEHPFDKMGRGNHFHGADDTKGSPFSKGRYNQYPGHFPEDFNGFN